MAVKLALVIVGLVAIQVASAQMGGRNGYQPPQGRNGPQPPQGGRNGPQPPQGGRNGPQPPQGGRNGPQPPQGGRNGQQPPQGGRNGQQPPQGGRNGMMHTQQEPEHVSLQSLHSASKSAAQMNENVRQITSDIMTMLDARQHGNINGIHAEQWAVAVAQLKTAAEMSAKAAWAMEKVMTGEESSSSSSSDSTSESTSEEDYYHDSHNDYHHEDDFFHDNGALHYEDYIY